MLQNALAIIRQRYSMKTIFWFVYSLVAVLWLGILYFVNISPMSKMLVFFLAVATMFVLLFPYLEKRKEDSASPEHSQSSE